MNKEMMQRLRTAGKYQRKAFRALFPENVGGHLDVIENEVKAMFMDFAFEMIKEYKKEEQETGETGSTAGRTKKVTIM